MLVERALARCEMTRHSQIVMIPPESANEISFNYDSINPGLALNPWQAIETYKKLYE